MLPNVPPAHKRIIVGNDRLFVSYDFLTAIITRSIVKHQ